MNGYRNSIGFLVGLILWGSLPSAAAQEILADFDREALEKKVRRILSEESSIIRWQGINDLFLLADLCDAEGNGEKASALYEEGLRLDSWRLEYQIPSARLLYERGDAARAVEKARAVHRHAGNAGLAREARELLAAIKPRPRLPAAPLRPASVPDRRMEIVLVPIGPVDESLLEIGMEAIQSRMGIPCSIAPEGMDPGKRDDFRSGHERFDARRLITRLSERYPPWEGPEIRYVIGVTEVDLLAPEDDRFPLRFYAAPGWGVLSHHLFLAAGREEPSVREKLPEWFAKDAVGCAFQLLGIPPCTMPLCSRSPSIEWVRMDQKGSELCPWCREALRSYLARPEPRASPDSVPAQLLKAETLSEENRPKEALSLYQELLQLYPDEPQVMASFLWFCGSHAWWPFGEEEEALARDGMEMGEEALKRWPGEPEISDALAWLAYKSGGPQRAISLLTEALARRKTCSRLYLLSMASGAAGQWDQAVRSYREALALQPEGKEADYKGYRQMAEALINGAQN